MEACGGTHEWGRELIKLRHDVRLLALKIIQPFVQRNKTDAADAHGIWTASQLPGMKFVLLKNDAQQLVLALRRLRAQLMKTRIMQTNELRGLLYEFGVVLPEGAQRVAEGIARSASQGTERNTGNAHRQPRRAGSPHHSTHD